MCDTCACSTDSTATTATVGATDGITVTYSVEGMTCGHCVNSVSGEVGGIDGVTAVSVDLKAGTVTLTSTSPIAVDKVAAAVDEAGYRLVA